MADEEPRAGDSVCHAGGDRDPKGQLKMWNTWEEDLPKFTFLENVSSVLYPPHSHSAPNPYKTTTATKQVSALGLKAALCFEQRCIFLFCQITQHKQT